MFVLVLLLMDTQKKLKLSIFGKLNKTTHKHFTKSRTKRLKLKLHSLEYEDDDHAELLIEGKKKHLWELVHYSKTGPIFCDVDIVIFQFLDLN